MESDPITKQGKQIFLRNEILEGGLDPQSFMDYMGTIKNEGENIDLDNWTMKELSDLVHTFKQQIKADTERLEEVKQSQIRYSQEIIGKILKSGGLKKQKIHYDKGLWDYEMINEQQCKAIPKPFNFNPKIKPVAHVVSWQVRSQGGFLGFGATKQLWLKIDSNFTQQPVERTNSDIEWYRNALLKFHPGSYIPPLAQLRAVQPQDKKGLTQRGKLVERFLNSVIQYEYLIQSQISKTFFTQLDHNKLTNYKNKQRSVGHSKNVGRIENLEGKFCLELSGRTQKFIKHSALFGKVAQETYSEIDGQINKVLSDMETLSKHVLYVSNSCGTLHQKYTKICGLNQIKNNNMQTITICLYNMLSNIGKNIKEHMSVIKEFSDDYIQSSIRSWEEFLLHDKRYQREMENYLTFKTDLLRKKERCFSDVTKWELESPQEVDRVARMNLSVMDKQEVFGMMFPRDNKMEEELRIWMAYLNKVYEDSFKMLLAEEEGHLREKLNVYIDRSAGLNNQTYFSKELRQLVGVKG